MNKKVDFIDLGRTDYKTCWEYQDVLFSKILQTKSKNRKENLTLPTKNHFIFCEHNHVYTLGNSGDNSNLLFDKTMLEKKGIDFHKTNRGGDITYHGPGQMVCYPILDMENFYTDIHKYLRDLEDIIINTLSFFGINASVNSEETGVWLDVGNIKERKICAMGIKVSRWVTMHGLALNVNTDLSYFDGIIPCGISNKGVTSISNELNKKIDIELVQKVFIKKFLKQFNATIDSN